jgi:hypothetical protein
MLKWLIYILKNLKARSFMEGDGSSPCKRERERERDSPGRVKCTFKQKMQQEICPFAFLCNLQQFKGLKTLIIKKELCIIQTDYTSHQTLKPEIHMHDLKKK